MVYWKVDWMVPMTVALKAVLLATSKAAWSAVLLVSTTVVGWVVTMADSKAVASAALMVVVMEVRMVG